MDERYPKTSVLGREIEIQPDVLIKANFLCALLEFGRMGGSEEIRLMFRHADTPHGEVWLEDAVRDIWSLFSPVVRKTLELRLLERKNYQEIAEKEFSITAEKLRSQIRSELRNVRQRARGTIPMQEFAVPLLKEIEAQIRTVREEPAHIRARISQAEKEIEYLTGLLAEKEKALAQTLKRLEAQHRDISSFTKSERYKAKTRSIQSGGAQRPSLSAHPPHYAYSEIRRGWILENLHYAAGEEAPSWNMTATEVQAEMERFDINAHHALSATLRNMLMHAGIATFSDLQWMLQSGQKIPKSGTISRKKYEEFLRRYHH